MSNNFSHSLANCEYRYWGAEALDATTRERKAEANQLRAIDLNRYRDEGVATQRGVPVPSRGKDGEAARWV